MESEEQGMIEQLDIQEKKLKNKFYSWKIFFPLVITIITVFVSVVTTKITISGNLQQDKEKFTQDNIISFLEEEDIVVIRKKILFLCESGLFSENKVERIKSSLDKYLIDRNQSTKKLLAGLEIYDGVNNSPNPSFYRNDLLKAVGYFSEAIELDPNNNDAIYYRGLANYFMGVDYDIDLPQKKALIDFDYLIKQDSTNSLYYFCRGRTFYDLKNDEMALNDLSKSIVLDSSYVFSYALRGLIHLGMKDTIAACNDFIKTQDLFNHLISKDSTYKMRNSIAIHKNENVLKKICK